MVLAKEFRNRKARVYPGGMKTNLFVSAEDKHDTNNFSKPEDMAKFLFSNLANSYIFDLNPLVTSRWK